MLNGWIRVDDQGDIIDMDAARCDIRRHKSGGGSATEVIEVALAPVVREVTVQVDCTHPRCLEITRHALGPTLRAGEDHDPLLACHRGDRGHPIGFPNDDNAVLEKGG